MLFFPYTGVRCNDFSLTAIVSPFCFSHACLCRSLFVPMHVWMHSWMDGWMYGWVGCYRVRQARRDNGTSAAVAVVSPQVFSINVLYLLNVVGRMPCFLSKCLKPLSLPNNLHETREHGERDPPNTFA